jgi:hypothetical protein
MAGSTLNSFAAVQAFLTQVIAQNGNDISGAPHKAFWNTTYTQFTTGNIPNVGPPPARILIPGNSAQSNIIMALLGQGALFGPSGTYGQMPTDGPPYFTAAQVAETAGWIDAGCPE